MSRLAKTRFSWHELFKRERNLSRGARRARCPYWLRRALRTAESFHRKVCDENGREESSTDEPVSARHRSIVRLVRRRMRWRIFHFYSPAVAGARATGKLFGCQPEWHLRVLDERNR